MKYLINLLHLLLTILQSEGRGASNNLINYHEWENYLGMCREEKNEVNSVQAQLPQYFWPLFEAIATFTAR